MEVASDLSLIIQQMIKDKGDQYLLLGGIIGDEANLLCQHLGLQFPAPPLPFLLLLLPLPL